MMSRNALCFLLNAVPWVAQAQGAAVAPELWDRPRSALSVLGEAAVKQAVNGYLARPAARIVIHHGAAQESMLQAEELRSWLVALALEPQRVGLRGGLKAGAALRIEIVSAQ